MPAQLIRVNVGETDVMVEARTLPGTQFTAKPDEAAAKLVDVFEKAQGTILDLAKKSADMFETVAKAGTRPSQIQVSFGLAFTVQGGIILVGASSEASLTVTLTYDRSQG